MARQGNNAISNQINMVGEGTVFEGTLRAKSDVRVSGRIAGKLLVDGKAIVASEGVIEGEISAKNADIAGSVQGEVDVEERLVLKSTARIDGNIKADRIVVEEGAVFAGECAMGKTVRMEKKAGNGKAAVPKKEVPKKMDAIPSPADGTPTSSSKKKTAK